MTKMVEKRARKSSFIKNQKEVIISCAKEITTQQGAEMYFPYLQAEQQFVGISLGYAPCYHQLHF